MGSIPGEASFFFSPPFIFLLFSPLFFFSSLLPFLLPLPFLSLPLFLNSLHSRAATSMLQRYPCIICMAVHLQLGQKFTTHGLLVVTQLSSTCIIFSCIGGATASIQDDGVVDITDPAENNSQYPEVVSYFKRSISESITSSGAEFDYLEDMGISISVAEYSISPGDAPLDLIIRPCFTGPFELPEGYESASTAYQIDIPQLARLQKDITIRIQHHVHLQTEDDCADMVFLTASATPQIVGKRQVYSFSVSTMKSVFKCGDQVGELSLRDFGLLKAGKKRISPRGTQCTCC